MPRPKLTSQQKERIKAWVAALRSGKFGQGKSRLKTGTAKNARYCCLGVACEVFKARTKRGRWLNGSSDSVFVLDEKFNSAVELPRPVNEYFGLEFQNDLGNSTEMRRAGNPLISSNMGAIQANDFNDYDFKMIADSVEQYYLGNYLGTLNGKRIPKQKT